MKKYFNFTLLTFAILLFTGCSSEEEIADNGGVPSLKGGVTFTFPTAKGGTTYATTPGVGFENDVDLANTTILMFNSDADPVLEGIYSGADITAGTVGTNKTATVVMPTTGITAGNKTFRFIVNNQTASTALATLATGQTWSTILPMITNDQPAGGLPKAALLMYGASAAIDIATVSNGGQITLKRRVARFDIQNSISTVQIQKVLVDKSLKSGFVLSGNTTDANTAAATENLTVTLAGADLAAANTASGLASAFYLYPSPINTTTIQIEATVNSVQKIFTVPARTIAANTRYILKVKDTNGEVSFELAVAEWDEATEIAIAEAGAPIISGFALSTNGGGTLNADALTYDVTNATSASVITLTTMAATSAGVNVSIVKEVGDLGNITVASSAVGALTYAAGYPQTHTINIPAYSGGAADIANRIVIRDKAAAANAPARTISLWSNATTGSRFYPGTSLEPVVLNGVTWAPVNVGAVIDNSPTIDFASTGYVYQFGRNIGFNRYNSINTHAGPLTTANAANYPNSFITSLNISPFDWVTPQENPGSWGAGSQGPCPQGWNIPTRANLTMLMDVYNGYKRMINNRLVFFGDGGKILYIPITGSIDHQYGAPNSTMGAYWSNESYLASDNNIRGYRFYFLNDGLNAQIQGVFKANAHAIRCVKAN